MPIIFRQSSVVDVGQSFATVSFVASTAAYSIYLARVWQLCAGKKLYRQSRLLLASKGAAAASLLFWSVALWTAAKGRDEGYWPALKFWWLPLGPFLLLIIVEHVLAMLASSSKDLASLKSRMYDFKSA
jgi:cytochrome bd-type quinol oxidase subunit 2